ncbi:MAG: hypothetical protein DWI22_02855 [Planctomycetota bacterium]|nr:MAG: hypothetical protein DWI22_02855 [Planctomycetota bacterium]
MQLLSLLSKRHGARRVIMLVLVASMVLPGCSLGVMAGKLFFDDPKMKSVFRKNTGTDLTKGEKTILIACSTSHQILSKYPGIRIDIVDKMSRILETRNVRIVPPDDVATWFDDHGEWGDFTELADEFDADYVMHIDLKSFAVVVPDSPNLLQGKTEGRVSMMEIKMAEKNKDKKKASVAVERSFSVMFPTTYPVPRESRSEEMFTENFLDRISAQLARMLYDHRPSEMDL